MSRQSSSVAAGLLLVLAFAAAPISVMAAPPAPGDGAAEAPGKESIAPPSQPAAVSGVPVAARPLNPGELLVPGSEFRYDSTGRRDPFKSLLELEKKQRDIAQLPPIQQFDLETVKVVGVVVDPGRVTQAMIRAPSGQTFVVRVGTIVGKNEGEITEITMQGIRILEKFVDFMNRETRKETFLKSHPAAGK